MATGVLGLAPKKDEVATYSATQARATAPTAVGYKPNEFTVNKQSTVSWSPVSSQPLDGYRLYRAEGTCMLRGYFVMAKQYGIVTNGEVPAPVSGGTYCHFLVAFNQAGESAPSNYVEYAYTAPPPQCPEKSYCMTLKRKARRQCLACQ